jgi:GNAT superfamily N-acetyltransferase
MIAVREATPRDAREIARVHVAAWQVAYRGLMADELLDGLSVDRREEFWREILRAPPFDGQRTWISALDGVARGFATAGPSRDPRADLRLTGEVQALYVDPPAWRQGHGRRLMQTAMKYLADRGHGEATLWMVGGNLRALQFYEALGWHPDGTTRCGTWEGIAQNEIRYHRRLSGD